MKHNTHPFSLLPYSLGRLLLCCIFWGIAGNLSAQCEVYFSYCPDHVVLTDCDHSGYEILDWPQPIAATIGGCTNFVMTQTGGPLAGTSVPVPGNYTVTYTAAATDIISGKVRKTICVIHIQVVADTEAPVFTYCPPDITLYTGDESTAPGIWNNPIAEDNCGGEVAVKTKIPCNSELGPGVHVVTYKAVDASGNVAYCSFTVTVIPGYQLIALNKVGTGVHSADLLEFGLSPNPFEESLSIKPAQRLPSELLVKVFDVRGREVAAFPWGEGSDVLDINSKFLVPGMYYFKICHSNGNFIKGLIGLKM